MTAVRKIALLISDTALFFASLAIMLFARYGISGWNEAWTLHLKPFFPIFCIWMLSLYITNLYNFESFRNARLLFRNLSGAVIGAVVVSITAFYIFSSFFDLMPKTNLAIFAVVFLILGIATRTIAARTFSRTAIRTAVFGNSPTVHEIENFLNENSGIGYHICSKNIKPFEERNSLEAFITKEKPEIIVVEDGWISDPKILETLYEVIGRGIKIIPLFKFYEIIFEKAPIEALQERWFVENISLRHPLYEVTQRIIDIVGAVVITIIVSPIALLAAIAVVATSKGPAIYAQKRVGKNGVLFTIYKFRTMRNDAEQHGPRYAVPNDDRLTSVGKLLRHTHLDEIPQLWNILMGHLSFVGPRPERPEFTETITSRVPFFPIRNFVKPGLTGWAQINYRYTSSVEEAKEKLAYDIFYIKHRSIPLNVVIMLKTVKRLLVKA